MAKPVLIDTGPIVALLSEQDQYNEICVEQASNIRLPVFTCWPVLTEAAYLLGKAPDVLAGLLSRCDGSRFEILSLDASDLEAIIAIIGKYGDQGFQLADVCLMHLAERENIGVVFTLDTRHFSVYRTASGRPLQLLPAS